MAVSWIAVRSILSKVITSKTTPWLIAAVAIGVALLSVRSCSNTRQALKESEAIHAKNLKAYADRAQEQQVIASTTYSKMLVLKDEHIASIMDSLKIRERQIKSLKKIQFDKATTAATPPDTVYQKLYELVEVNPMIPTRQSIKHDNCLTIEFEFTPYGINTTARRNFQLTDISYWKRRRLFGWKWTPRIGQKEIYQTLITNCGDTIRVNQKITFEK